MNHNNVYTKLLEADELLPRIFDAMIVNSQCEAKHCRCREGLKESNDMVTFLSEQLECVKKIRNDSMTSLMGNPIIRLAADNYINVGIEDSIESIVIEDVEIEVAKVHIDND